MAVRKRSRRKLAVGDRQYVWYVKEDDDSPDHILHVLSDDKQFIVQYRLAQPPSRQYVTVLGKEFPRATGTGGVWRRFRCPRWDSETGIISSGGVRSLIDWCMETSEETVEVDSAGRAVPLGGCCTSCGVDVRGMIPLNIDSCHKCGQPIAERAG